MITRHVIPSWSTATPLERTRTFTNKILSEQLVDLALEQLLQAAIDAKVGDLIPMIATRLGSEKLGYLLRINLYSDLVGKPRPTTNLISAIGVGLEPVDALAAANSVPSIGARPPENHVRRYLWCTRNADDLVVTCLDEILGAQLESQARTEARKRHLLGMTFAAETNQAMQRINRAKTWQDLANQRLQDVQREDMQLRIDSLTRAFAASQDRFNDAVAEYRAAERQLAATAKDAEMLQTIGAMMSLLRTGFEVHSGLQLEPSETTEAALRWRQHQAEMLGKARIGAAAEVDSLLPQLRELDQRLRTEWKGLEAPVPAAWKPPKLH